MFSRNSGTHPDDILKNRFTRYLCVAVWRCRVHAIRKAENQPPYKLVTDIETLNEIPAEEQDFCENLSVLDQIENQQLLLALQACSALDQKIFINHALRQLAFSKIATELGMTCKAVSHRFYRFRNRMKATLMRNAL